MANSHLVHRCVDTTMKGAVIGRTGGTLDCLFGEGVCRGDRHSQHSENEPSGSVWGEICQKLEAVGKPMCLYRAYQKKRGVGDMECILAPE